MMQTDVSKGSQSIRRSRKNWRFSSIFLIVTMISIFCIACGKDSPDKSPIDGVSDEVYEQLVQHYFFAKKMMEVLKGEAGEQYTKGNSWIKEHELYEAAEEYAEEHSYYTMSVFPNPLLMEHAGNHEQFSETEQIYIEKVLEFINASSRADMEEYERLKVKVKEELDIKDSYDIFE